MNPHPEIRRGTPGDLPQVTALLADAGLPTSDLASIYDLSMWVLEVEKSLTGVIALERYGSEGLLRSLAVTGEYRRRGFGSLLVDRLEADARAGGIRRLVLLTETAETFFRNRGYVVTGRDAVSDEIKQSAEFRSLCPASARCLCKILAAD
jgi:N-acetylglutamate synthase-like GNAT family acetyltransferase